MITEICGSMRSISFRTAVFLAFCLFSFRAVDGQESAHRHWVSAWGTALYAPFFAPGTATEVPIQNQTIRMVIRPTLEGDTLRVKLSNSFGNVALHVGEAHIALVDQNGQVSSASDHVLRFAGSTDVIVPAGAPMLSDPVSLHVDAFTQVAVSIYIPDRTEISNCHGLAKNSSYLAAENQTGRSILAAPVRKDSWYFLSGIEVLAPISQSAIVAFGDSITDGAGTSAGEYADWPDQLVVRLYKARRRSAIAVINEGISGNRILHDAAGASALARFDRDVLANPGAKYLFVLEGINDIGFPRIRMEELHLPSGDIKNPFVGQKVSAEEITGGLEQLIQRAHAAGMRVIGATLTPFEGTNSWDQEGESIRQSVNQWIRSGGAYDEVVDFDAVIRDPEHPRRMRAAYDSGDHIHPSAAGYKAMANAIDLNFFK